MVVMIAAGAFAQAGDGVRLLKDCSNPEEVAATVRNSDHVQVRYSLGGDTQTCYAVSATIDGKSVEGYLLGAEHPDVAAFEREARSHIPAIPDPPKPAPAAGAKEQAAAPEPPKSFAGLSGTSPNGRQVSLSQLSAPTVVLYFWSANDKKSVREADAMDGIYETYRNKGVGLMGIVSGGSAAQVHQAINDGEVIWPQIMDHGDIAARYPATKETKYFILDRGRNVVAALNSPSEVQRALAKMRKAGGGAQ